MSVKNLIAVALGVLSLLNSCDRSEGIAGKWRSVDGRMVWEFTSNGAISQGAMRGRYSFGDNERIKIQTPFATTVYRMQLQNDHLTLADPRGTTLEFTRLKEGAP
jgi:hypothetical protein